MLHCNDVNSSAPCAFAAPTHCPLCGDWMVAPLMSEFVEGGEIRHHWVCESCGQTSITALDIADE